MQASNQKYLFCRNDKVFIVDRKPDLVYRYVFDKENKDGLRDVCFTTRHSFYSYKELKQEELNEYLSRRPGLKFVKLETFTGYFYNQEMCEYSDNTVNIDQMEIDGKYIPINIFTDSVQDMLCKYTFLGVYDFS